MTVGMWKGLQLVAMISDNQYLFVQNSSLCYALIWCGQGGPSYMYVVG